MSASPSLSGDRPGSEPYLIAVDLGGSWLRVAVFDRDGSIRQRSTMPTPPDDPGALVGAVREASAACGTPAAGAVVGVPGPVDYEGGEVLALPNLPGWERHLAARRLERALGIAVLLANDADLAALGEHRYGAGRGGADMLYVGVGTGVGGGVVLGGRLLRGRRSAAEVGHFIIDHQSGATVEQLGSGTALARLAGEPAITVGERAMAGDRAAQALVREVADAVAVGVVNAVYAFMPERVVIGGGLAHLGALLLDPVRERLARARPRHAVTTEHVMLAERGDEAGLLGAYALALDVSGDRGGGGVERTLPRSL